MVILRVNCSRDAPQCVMARTKARDAVSLSEQSIQLTGDKAGGEGGNRVISDFEGEKSKCKCDLVDKKWNDKASREGDLCRRVL